MYVFVIFALFHALQLGKQEELGYVYDDVDCNGRAHKLNSVEGDPDLSIYAHSPYRYYWLSAYFTGAWLFYSEKTYARLLKHQYNPTWACIPLNTSLAGYGAVQSARPVKGSDKPGITIYAEKNFQGYQVHVQHNATSTWNTTGSYIITGNFSWTLYGGDHFNGKSKCVMPTNTVFDPTFVSKFDEYSVFSAKTGCT